MLILKGGLLSKVGPSSASFDGDIVSNSASITPSNKLDGKVVKNIDTTVPSTTTTHLSSRVNSSRFESLPIVLLTNANRLYNKVDELFCLVNREHLDLISITETWLSADVPDSVHHLPSFVIFRKDRPDRLGGGVLCYARASLQPYAINPLLDRGQDFELLWIAMRPPRLRYHSRSLIQPPMV